MRKKFKFLKRYNWERRGLDVQRANDLLEWTKECQICGDTDRLNIDHDHETNIIRGVLCNRCNLGIGFLKDNPYLLRKAAQYLVDNQTELLYN